MGNETRHVLDVLRRWHDLQPGNGPSKPWVYAEEVRVAPGFGYGLGYGGKRGSYPRELMGAGEQRIDAYAAHTWPSKKGLRVAYEVKVTMADLRSELRNEGKADAALFLSNEFYLVAPDSMRFLLTDIPAEWGVKRVSKYGNLRTTRKAPYRDTPLPPYSFMLSLARRLQADAG